MTLFEMIEEQILQMPQQPLTTADHGPCMNCSFTNKQLIAFYQWLFGVLNPETYARLDKVVMGHYGLTHYDHFLPRHGLPKKDFLNTEKNVFWCLKVETFLTALREVLGNETGAEASTASR